MWPNKRRLKQIQKRGIPNIQRERPWGREMDRPATPFSDPHPVDVGGVERFSVLFQFIKRAGLDVRYEFLSGECFRYFSGIFYVLRATLLEE
ncbi:hypothetical protein GWI33_010780 [Rhynchophorus ferrugineus]|uniref:Uncharacterized protein n=1 Tax=Rhynchophorus ferrugineus TaxID=354439 RepID=A0A834ISR5_RHYFE|nr:hypothetical protein GWI33_010780 [Rhynchophorus ferrugineus]